MIRITESPLLLILVAVVYAIIPLDVLPDFMKPLGLLDDVVVLGIVIWHLLRLAKNRNSQGVRFAEGVSSPSQTAEKETPHAVLGVSLNATQEEIEKAYKQKIKEHHPDRVHGLGREIREVAERKTQQINEAYDILRKEQKA